MTSIRPSTVVLRTDAGRAELATPAHGLSIVQRRFLTLLDTACSVDELAHRHRLDADRLERDLARLATLGLVACMEPAPANDPFAGDAANEPLAKRPAGVRLAAPRTLKRGAPIALALLAAAGTWAAWRHLSSPEPSTPIPSLAKAQTETAAPAQNAPAIEPQPIATRVLRGNPTDRPRDAGKDVRAQPKRDEPRAEADASLSTPSLPVERRRPGGGAAIDPSLTRAPMAAPAADPAPALMTMRSPSGLPALLPMPAAPASSEPAPVPIARETPSFPREALAAGLDSGSVKARLTIGAKGNVESVDIVSASHRSFHRAVREALAHWRFEPGAPGRTTDVDVAFKRD